jgi:hypothetical protein
MRLSPELATRLASGLLAMAMAAVMLGYALFFMSPQDAAANPATWCFAAFTAVVTFLTATSSRQTSKEQRI